jgi:hypothetical protein
MYPVELFAFMVTEALRLWSDPPLVELPCAMGGAETAGTAGETADLPFTGEIEADFPC